MSAVIDTREFLYELDIQAEVDGLYDAIEYHRRNIYGYNRVSSLLVVFVCVLFAVVTIFIILRWSTKTMEAFKRLIIAQVIVTCLISAYIYFSYLYAVLPYRVIFNMQTGWFSPQATFAMTLLVAYLLVLEIQLCAFAMLRNALAASHLTMARLNHKQTVRWVESLVTAYYALLYIGNLYPATRCIDAEQQHLFRAMILVIDPRLRQFLEEQAPMFIVFRRALVPFLICTLINISAQMAWLFFLVYITVKNRFPVSPSLRKLQRRILITELVTIASFFVTIIFPVICSLCLVIFSEDKSISRFPLTTLVWEPGQSLCIITCLVNLTMITPYRKALLDLIGVRRRIPNSVVVSELTIHNRSNSKI